MSGAAIRKVPEEESPERELRAPLFSSLMETLDEDRRLVIADLGPVRASTIDLLAGSRVRIDVIDLAARLDELAGADETDRIEALVDQCFPPLGSDRYGLVLCWNLLNYLDRPQLKALMGRLAALSAPGGALHALIEYSSPVMPVSPARIEPAGRQALTCLVSSGETRPSPRYAARDLEKCMPGFGHERTMLLGNGMQEYLFRCSGR